MSVIATKRMWCGGPLRQLSTERVTSSWVKRDRHWAGMYVCDACMEPTPHGVYGARQMEGYMWLCAACYARVRLRQRPSNSAVAC